VQIKERDKMKSKLYLFIVEKDVKNKDLQKALIKKMIMQSGINIEVNNDIYFFSGEYGKPYLKNQNNIFFNLSHSKKILVCGVFKKEIGVDVEYINHPNLGIAKRFFNEEEVKYIFQCKNILKREKRFYEVWTKKEAYVKYLGKGLSIDLKSFNVIKNKSNPWLYSFTYMNYCISICVPLKAEIIIERVKI